MPRKKKTEEEDKSKEEPEMDAKLKLELDKLGREAEKVFIESEDNPDNWGKYPKLVVCSTEPQKYVYPLLLQLEHSNVIRLHALNNYVPTILRLQEMMIWCMDLRLKRKRMVINNSGKKLIVNEYVLEKIPACRR